MSETFPAEHRDAQQRMALLPRYYEWTFSLIEPWLGRRVLEAGCGIGNFTRLLAERCRDVVAVDADEESLEIARRRFQDQPSVRVVTANLESDGWQQPAGNGFDNIVCLDLLEHVRRDAQLLRSFHGIAARDARLIVKAPAGPWLFGPIDVASCHYRRYSIASLKSVLVEAGWKPVTLHYMNCCGVLPYWVNSVLLRRRTNFSRTFSRKTLSLINAGMPLLKLTDRLLGPPMGLSIVAAAARSAHDEASLARASS